MFCKECGTLLVPKNTFYGKWMSCPNGHTQPKLNQAINTLNIKNTKQTAEIRVNDGINYLAVHNHKCKKCGYDKAQLIERSCSYSDEDNIYQMKCGKCGYIEQLEGKVT